MVNNIYYPRRATRLMRPGMTREQYENGYWETDKIVNCIVGISNEVARLAIADGISAVEKSKFYRHEVKHWTKETFREQEAYENGHLRKFMKDQQQVFLDFLDAVEKEYRPHIFKMYMSLKLVMLKHRQSNAELKAKVECGRVVAVLACANFDAIMEAHRKKFGADYTALFQQFRYTKPLAAWTRVAEKIVVNDHPEQDISLTGDANCQLGYDILARKMADFDLMNRIGCVALRQNMDIAEKYANEEDLQELREQYGEHAMAQY